MRVCLTQSVKKARPCSPNRRRRGRPHQGHRTPPQRCGNRRTRRAIRATPPRGQLVNLPPLNSLFTRQRETRLLDAHTRNPLGHIIAPTASARCLNPCPDPPPTNQTFSISGCRSIKKSPFDVFSYWQTRVSMTGAFARAGKRFARNLRIVASSSVVVNRSSLSGSISGPCSSRPALNPRPSISGVP